MINELLIVGGLYISLDSMSKLINQSKQSVVYTNPYKDTWFLSARHGHTTIIIEYAASEWVIVV